MITQLYHDLVKNLLSILAKCKLSNSSYPNSSKCFDYPNPTLWHRSFSHIKTLEKKLKRRQGDEGKQEDQETRAKSRR
jgi:hypothetical protein